MWLALLKILSTLWSNRRIIAELIGLAVACFIAWWFFIHNPKVISELEADKTELSRQITALQAGQKLLNDIEKGKRGIDIEVFKNISTIRAAAVPRRAVLIRAGMPM